jgi:thioester reductase-like protein
MKISTRTMTALSVFFSIFLSVALSACTPVKSIKQPVYALDSKQVIFDEINMSKTADGIKVSGQVRKKSLSSRRIKIAGHIHILLKNSAGEVLETVNARTHRLYARGVVWHFDGVLKQGLPVGSVVVIKYHGTSIHQENLKLLIKKQ